MNEYSTVLQNRKNHVGIILAAHSKVARDMHTEEFNCTPT